MKKDKYFWNNTYNVQTTEKKFMYINYEAKL